ncbi:MAG: hypothetical protein Q4F41_21190 [Eubacteriales bacterium]|nr:hypothetical protein [Eubacteriales bacterium]
MNVPYSETQIVQNLKDAGCTDEFIQAFLTIPEQKKVTDGMKLLQKHRRFLLDNTHEWEKKIDCLDYLINRMRDNENSVKERTQ